MPPTHLPMLAHDQIPTHEPGRSARHAGLGAAEVVAARARHGENRLPSRGGASAWTILIAQFTSPLVYVILAAAAISLALWELGDFAIIMVVVAANVVLGFAQEYQAHRTYLALRSLLKPVASVIRDGERREVEVWELVPGDLVALVAGDRVPADGLLVEAIRLAVDEAILTGENEPVTKSVPAVARPAAGAQAGGAQAADGAHAGADRDERSRVFMGSTVVTGRALARVTATGTATELGQIAAGLAERDEDPTPLQARLRAFGRVLAWVVVAGTAVILVAGLVMGRPFLEMLRTAIVLAVATIPEGLLIAVTVILVLGMQRILKRRGLVRRLLAVETLGSVTVICTDKTGTLTEGRMRVSRVDLEDEARAWQTMVLCNNLEGAVEVALWEYAEQQVPGGVQALLDSTERRSEELFTSETKYMITEVMGLDPGGDDPAGGTPEGAGAGQGRRDGDSGEHPRPGGRRLLLKGAPEIVAGMCEMDPERQSELTARIERWAGDGLRLLGLASRAGGELDDHRGYAWAGLVGMEDPVRAGVPEAVALARDAGIRVVMITGDYRGTAESVARTTGIPVTGTVVEGREIGGLSDQELRERIGQSSVFARIRPQDKLRIVHAFEAGGEVTAMIGDGVNDAPALRHADIGVVVGSATDVARETSDLVLLDSNFRTIVAAVEEGRVIFDNIRKVIVYVLSDSFSEVLIVFAAMILGWPTPLLVTQILWINLVCDGPPDLVLGFEPREDGIMRRRPHARDEPIVDRLGIALVAAVSISAAVLGLILFGWYHLALDDAETGRSLVFVSFAVSSVLYILAYRSLRTPLFRMHPPTANRPLVLAVAVGLLMALLPFWLPGLGELLGVVPLDPAEWAIVAGFAAALIAIIELTKVRFQRVSGRADSGRPVRARPAA